MTQIWTVTNLKPGTAKTTSAVWLAHAVHELGRASFLADSDPGGTKHPAARKLAHGDLGHAARWDRLSPFPFAVVSLATRDIHRTLRPTAQHHGADIAVVDSPPLEDEQGIATSAIRGADVVVIPVAPTRGELDRMSPVLDVIADVNPLRESPPTVLVLLTRCVSQASSTQETHNALTDAGFDVLETRIPRLELFAQSHGLPVQAKGSAYQRAAQEIIARTGGAA